MFSFCFIYYAENFIDGRALVALPNDFIEFCHVVPQSGLRMRLKDAIQLIKEGNFEHLSEVRHFFINCSFVLVLVSRNNCTSD